MTEYGDIAGEDNLLQDGMIFRLDPREIAKKDDAPMWAPASSSPSDWFFADDGS